MPLEFPSSSTRGQRALAAIVVTDGVGFSARMSANEELTLNLIQRDLQLMHSLCETHEGQVLKSTGDGLLMYFVSAAQAVNCAVHIQRSLADQAAQMSPDQVLAHRIGIHLGDVFLSESDVMGNGVNIAARLQTEAEPGGICISQTVYDVVKSRLPLSAVYLGPLNLKNIQETVPAYHIAPASPSRARPAHAASASATDDERSSPSTEVAPGHLVHSRYSIQKVLGQGGFGRTYLAKDTHRFDDLCVLKEFLPINKSDYVVQKSRDLFEREAKALYQIDHPQIPRFLAWFTHDSRLFIVQEYINGKTYSHLLRERQQQGRCFSEKEVIQWLDDLLGVLNYLHSLGIVHRDISPDNIMLPDGGSRPVLIDFGLVKQTVSEMWTMAPSEWRTSQNSFVGKLGYAPPEQIRMGQCFPCSDLYALGVTAIVLLTGYEPNLLMDQGSLEWQWRSHISVTDQFAQLLDRMLAEKPNDRFQSAQEVMIALKRFLSVEEIAINRALQELQAEEGKEPAYPSSPLPNPAALPRRQSQSASNRSTPLPNLGRSPSIPIPPHFLEACRQELVKYIGPMASYVVAEVQSKHSQANPAQLLSLLAQEIPNGAQAIAFQHALQQMAHQTVQQSFTQQSTATASSPSPPTPPQSPITRNANATTAPRASSSAVPPPPPPRRMPGPAQPTGSSITPDFLDRCRTELARSIGPMASFILDDVLAQAPPTTPQQLVRAIAAEIPDPKKAQEFERQLLSP